MKNDIFLTARQVTLYLLIVMVGLMGGIHFGGVMAPIVSKMTVTEFTAYHQMMDGYMAKRMPIFGQISLGLYILNLFLFIKRWRSATFWIILVCFALLVSDIAITVTQQIPINQYVQSVDAKNLTSDQLITLERMKSQTIENFATRDILSIASFALLGLTPFLLQRQNKKD
jgi:hypothetical protein